MKDTSNGAPAWYRASDCQLADLQALTSQSLSSADVPHAAQIEKNIPIYDAGVLDDLFDPALHAEWAWNFLHGAGVAVIKNGYADTAPIDAATKIFHQIIAEEGSAGKGGGDHFAKAGANARIWNSLQKLCLSDPAVFAGYHGVPALDAIAQAWLGPNYQLTAQVNLVRPGGAAQTPHRDYHLGFMSIEQAERYPAHIHHLSPVMTLQGGVAHGPTPIEAGPTKFLPFSQAYGAGYTAYALPEFTRHFEENFVQIPLEKGDLIFFNPATFHAAGTNVTEDVHRLVNLFQINSAFGRAIEAIDRPAMVRAVYPVLKTMQGAARDAVLHAVAEGYAFPTNLDTDPPVGGLAPKTQADIVREGLAADWDSTRLDQALLALADRQHA